MRGRLRVAGIAVTVAAAVGVAGCGTEVVDNSKLEKAIEKDAQTQANLTLKVSCPSNEKAKKGGTFDCTATLPDKKKATVVVTQQDAKGDVHFTISAAQLHQ